MIVEKIPINGMSPSKSIGIVKRRPVATGEFTNYGIEILEGVSDGEQLVTAGVSKLIDGQKVKLPNSEEK